MKKIQVYASHYAIFQTLNAELTDFVIRVMKNVQENNNYIH